MSYKGQFVAGDVVDFKFTTRRPSTGVPYTLAGTPAVRVYKSDSTTQSTAGVSLTVDFDSVTGLNHVHITTASDGTFYANGSQFDVVIEAGTVDGVSVVGECVGRFNLGYAAVNVSQWGGNAIGIIDGKPMVGLDPDQTWVDGSFSGAYTTGYAMEYLNAALDSNGIGVKSLAANTITATSLAADASAEIAAAVLAAGDVDGYSLEATLKLCLAALAGKLSGAETTTIVIRAADDSKNRITATVDASGNRTAITLDATG